MAFSGLPFPQIFPNNCTIMQDNPNPKSLFPSYPMQTAFPNPLSPPQYQAPFQENSAQNVMNYLNNLSGNQESQNFDGKFITIPYHNLSMNLRNSVVQKAQELGVNYKFEGENFVAWGAELSIDLFSQFVNGLYVESKTHQQERWNLLSVSSNLLKKKEEVLVQKTIPITEKMLNNGTKIENYVSNVKLNAEYKDGSLVVVGTAAQLLDFMEFMYNLAINIAENPEPCSCQKSPEISSPPPQFCIQDINLSSSHRLQNAQIEAKAKELNLELDLGYDIATVRGLSENIEKFKGFMQDVEQFTKRSLYPRYYNEYEKNMYTEIDVGNGTDEWKAATSLFYRSMPDAKVTKLTRIQNKYLMDHYISTLEKRQDFGEKYNMHRQMLFHGTGRTKPELIYRESDTGFDLQFANKGLYGFGLYFAVDASYSHKDYAHRLGGNRYQILLADVFVGKPWKSGYNQPYNKAPKGYDSVVQPKGLFYIVYNNFHSYPLYLFEYSLE